MSNRINYHVQNLYNINEGGKWMTNSSMVGEWVTANSWLSDKWAGSCVNIATWINEWTMGTDSNNKQSYDIIIWQKKTSNTEGKERGNLKGTARGALPLCTHSNLYRLHNTKQPLSHTTNHMDTSMHDRVNRKEDEKILNTVDLDNDFTGKFSSIYRECYDK